MISKYLKNIIVLTFITQMIYTLNQETVIKGTACPNGYEKFKGILLNDQTKKFEDFEKCIDKNFLIDSKKKIIILDELKNEVKNNNINYCFLKIADQNSDFVIKSFSISPKSKCLDKSIFDNCDTNLICPPYHQIIYIIRNVYPCVPEQNIDQNHRTLQDIIYKNDCLDKENFTKLDFSINSKTYCCMNNQRIKLESCSIFQSCSNADCYYINSLQNEFCIPSEYQNFQGISNSFRPILNVFLKQKSHFEKIFGLLINEYTMDERKNMRIINPNLVDSDFELLDYEKEQVFKEMMVNVSSNKVQDCKNGSKRYYIRLGDSDGVFCIDHVYDNKTKSLLKKEIYGVDYNIKNINDYFNFSKSGEFTPFTLEEAQDHYNKKKNKII